MQKRKTITAIALALGLTYMPAALYADHHEGSGMEGSGMGHADREAKEAAKSMKDEAKAGTEAKAEEAADTLKGTMHEGSGGGMAEKTSEKVSEGSH